MNKEDILKRYKAEGVDEGQEQTNQFSDNKGFFALCGLAILLMIYKHFINQPFGDIGSLFFIFLSVGSFYRFKKGKERSALYFSLFTGLLCLAFLIDFIVNTVSL